MKQGLYLNGKISSQEQAELWFVNWALVCPGRCSSKSDAREVFKRALHRAPAAVKMVELSGIGFAPDLALALLALNKQIDACGEFPQVLFQISTNYGVNHEELQAQYDAQFVN